MKASMVGVWVAARTPKRTRDAAAAIPVGLMDVRIELTENVVLGILGGQGDGAGLLVDVFSGRTRADRGKIDVDGADPHRRAAIRARIGVLAPWQVFDSILDARDEVPLARTVGAWVAAARSIQSGGAPDGAGARALLEKYGLGALEARATDALSSADARGVELALALETPNPALVLLSEPFTRVGGIDPNAVRERISELGRTAPVIVTSPSVTELRTVARDVVVLSRGRLVQGGEAAELLDGKGRAEIHVWLASHAKETLRALLDTPGVCGAAWEGTSEPELPAEPAVTTPPAEGEARAEDSPLGETTAPPLVVGPDAGVLKVQHVSMDALGVAIADAVVKTNARVVSMREVVPARRAESR